MLYGIGIKIDNDYVHKVTCGFTATTNSVAGIT